MKMASAAQEALDAAAKLVKASRAVAKILVVYHRRAGGQSQYSTLLDLDATSDRVQAAVT